MAYEGRASSPQYNPSRQSQPDPKYLQPNSHSPYSNTAMPDLEPVRSRGSSIARQDGYTSDSSRYSQRTKPINEAINSAFTTTHAADSGIPPELLDRLTSQITANVIQQLRSTNLQPNSSNASQTADNTSSTAGSPPMGRASVYTPPSPNRPAEEFPQPSPRKSFAEKQIYDRSTPPPERRGSPLSQIDPVDNGDSKEDRPSRPQAPQRVSTSGDMTVLEKIWGKLFIEDGEATLRLGQFLRGIAVHLIEAYEPKYSLVVTPTKMQQFYQTTKIANEIYPWQVVFDDRTSSISRMLRELEAQHHLVQDKPGDRPDIPGLTPQGFQTWATLLIKAHPEQEFERMAKAAMDMPIDNPDEDKERFPKELTRRLFPKQADAAVAAKLQKAMSVHCNVTFKTRTESSAKADSRREDDATPLAEPRSSQDSTDRGDPTITPTTSHTSSSSNTIRHRGTKPQSFSSQPEVLIDSEEENAPTPQPIERERKPYVAQPGGGKTSTSLDNSTAEIRPAASTSDNRPPPNQESRLGRSGSTRSNGYDRPRPAPISVHQAPGTAPIEIPESRHHRTSTYRREGPSGSAPRRTRSPSASKDSGPSSSRGFAFSDPNDVFTPFNQSSTPNIFEPPPGYDRDRRYRDYESARRERFPEDRYDPARMAAYDPRDRERDRERADVRPRGSSIAQPLGLSVDPNAGGREEESYRREGGYSAGQPHSAGVGGRRDERERDLGRERERERDIRERDTRERDGGYVAGMPGSAGGHYPPTAYRDGR